MITDHQPLLGIINRKNLDAINNVRIQRLMAKLLGYSFQVEWIPGKNHHIADCLSRNPVFTAPDHKDIIIQQVTEVIMDEPLAELSEVAKADKDYQEVVTHFLYDGKKILNLRRSHPALKHHSQWDNMAVVGVFLTVSLWSRRQQGAFRRTLRECRNCPRYDGLSPAQWLYGRRQ